MEYRPDRNGFIAGIYSTESQIVTNNPVYLAELDKGRNLIILPGGGAPKRQGTIFLKETDPNVKFAVYQYYGSSACLVEIRPTGITFTDFGRGATIAESKPHPSWDQWDFEHAKCFVAENKFLLRAPMRPGVEGRSDKVRFYQYENIRDPNQQNVFNIVFTGERFYSNEPYAPMRPTRKVELTKSADNVITMRIVPDRPNDPAIELLKQEDVGRTVLVPRAVARGVDQSNIRGRPHKLQIIAVNVAAQTATLQSLMPDVYNYPEICDGWMMSADTSMVAGVPGKLGEPHGFAMFGNRLAMWWDDTICISTADTDPLNFEYTNDNASSAMTKYLDYTVQWCVSDRWLLVGTRAGLYIIGAKAEIKEGIIELNTETRRTSTQGAAPILPIIMSDSIIYVNPEKRTFTKLIAGENSYASQSIMTHIGSLFDAKTENKQTVEVVKILLQTTPLHIIWIILSDGRMLSAVIGGADPVYRVTEHRLGGGDESYVLDGEIVPGPEHDLLVLHVRRPKGDQAIYTIETLDIGTFSSKEMENGNYMDSITSLVRDEPILNLVEGDHLKLRDDRLHQSVSQYIGSTGNCKLCFAPLQIGEPWIIYNPYALTYVVDSMNQDTVMRRIIINPEATDLERRATIVNGDWSANPFCAVYETNLKVSDIRNDDQNRVVIRFRQSLTVQQMRELAGCMFVIDNLGAILDADAASDLESGFNNHCFRFVYNEAERRFTVGNPNTGISITAIVRTGIADFHARLAKAVVFIGGKNETLVANDRPNETIMTVGKRWYDDWTGDPVNMKNFEISTCPGMPQYEGQKIVMLPVPDAPGEYRCYSYPGGHKLPLRLDEETAQEQLIKEVFYRTIKIIPASTDRATYAAAQQDIAKQGSGRWQIYSVTREALEHLMHSQIQIATNENDSYKVLELTDDDFELINGVQQFVLSEIEPVFSVGFGFIYEYVLCPVKVVVQLMDGTTEIVKGRVKSTKMKVKNAVGGTYSPDATGNPEFPIKYDDNETGTIYKEGELVTNTINLNMPTSVMGLRNHITTYIRQYSPRSIMVENIMQVIDFDAPSVP